MALLRAGLGRGASYYRDRLWVRNVHYLVELDPATGKRLRLGDASWGWGGMAFQKNRPVRLRHPEPVRHLGGDA